MSRLNHVYWVLGGLIEVVDVTLIHLRINRYCHSRIDKFTAPHSTEKIMAQVFVLALAKWYSIFAYIKRKLVFL